MEEFGIFLIIVVTLNVILFFKIWQATNDIGTIKNHLLGEPIKKQIEVADMIFISVNTPTKS